jgi:ribonuclease E
LFGFIKRIFSSAPAVEEKPAPANDRGRNQGRNGDRNRNRGRRGDRGDRAERPTANTAEGTPTEGGNNRNGNRNNRNANRNNQNGPKPERQEANRNQGSSAAVTPATEAATGNEAHASADGEERRGRGRNRRGRGRSQRGEGTSDTTTSPAASASTFSGPPSGMAGASATMPMQNLANSFGNVKPATAKPERAPRAPRAPRPAKVEAPTPVVAVAAAIEVSMKAIPELPKVAFQALEETPLHSVVQSAGMIWVATDSSKLAEVQGQIQAEPVVVNLGRTPKPAASLQPGPMVLVETGDQEKTV